VVADRSERRYRRRPSRSAQETHAGCRAPDPACRAARRSGRAGGDAATGARRAALAAGGVPTAADVTLSRGRRLRNDPDADGADQRLAARTVAPRAETAARGDVEGAWERVAMEELLVRSRL